MRQGEEAEAVQRSRRATNGAPKPHRRAAAGHSLGEVIKFGRGLPRKLQREMEADPSAVLATVGCASFIAGTILGSRLGRALLAAALPLGIQRLVGSELGPRMWAYVEGLLMSESGKGGAGTP